MNTNQGNDEDSPRRVYDPSGFSGRSDMAMDYSNDTDENPPENMQYQRNTEKISIITHDKHPSKIDSPTKMSGSNSSRGSVGNSPTYPINSKYSEESKSPSNR
mmetsp:Transcript_63566/g.73922  ORF Transcript_63566/g.73922 Transcript_63566/m.73922 type:complete len:103 (+) Transcript_63566:36-344(+)